MLTFKYYFSNPEVDPFDEIVWETRIASIKEDGKTLFQKEVEVPSFWSQNATDIIAQHYLKIVNGEEEKSVKQCVSRVSKAFAKAGVKHGYFDKEIGKIFERELRWLLVNQYFCFNSPVWYNLGVEEKPQTSACFIQSVEDTLQSLCELQTSETLLFRNGSGTGSNFSSLREKNAGLSGGGGSSGPVSFMKGFDMWAGVTKSAGKTRRAAKLVNLDVTHPDIIDFIDCKVIVEKMAGDLFKAGWPSDYNGIVYASLPYQNANHSVRVTDDFMKAVENDEEYELKYYKNTKKKHLKAKEVFRRIAEAAHFCADPGLQFHDTINSWHTSPKSGPIVASNPCQREDAYILTPEGIRTFGDIGVGSIIWSGEKWTRVVNKFATGIKPVYQYKTRAGIFEGTEDHRVFQKGSRIEVKNAETIDICKGPTCLEKSLNTQDIIDGLVLGDGGVHKASGNKVILYLGEKDQEILNSEIKDLIIKKTSVNRLSWDVQTTIRDSELPHTYNRKIPNRFIFGGETKVRGFLRGLYSANGSICGGRITLKAASLNVIEDVQLMLSSIGISSYYTVNRESDVEFRNGAYTCKQSYDLNISTDKLKFRDYIGFIHKYKTDKLNEICKDYIPQKSKTSYEIIEKNLLGEFPVYDITVEAEEHSYWTGGLLVSNCSEYMYLDDSACNLASHNLKKYLRGGKFDCVAFQYATELGITAMEIAVEIAGYPTKKITENSKKFRPLGIGWSNGGALLMEKGIPYDSEAGRFLLASITSLMSACAYRQSGLIAKEVGAFEGFAENKEPFLEVIKKHSDANHKLRHKAIEHGLSTEIRDLASSIWLEVENLGLAYGYRNAQISVLAPAGTISFMMDCDTTGVEPDIALVKYKKLAGGGWMKIVNQSVRPALVNLGYTEAEIVLIEEHLLKYETILGAPNFSKDHLPIFDCAVGVRFIKPTGHIKMMAELQPFLSGAISKTVNLPASATVDDVENIYMQSWKLGLKAVAIYRDNCKASQPLNVKDYVEQTDETCGLCGGKVIKTGSCNTCTECGTTTSCG